MKLILIIALCTILLFQFCGYSQFKTTPIEEIAHLHEFCPPITVIVEGYVFRDPLLFLVEDIDVYARNCPMRFEEYILLIGNVKFLPCRGMSNHVRVKGIVIDYHNREGREGFEITVIQPALDVIQYREVFSARQYENIRGNK